MIKNIIWLLLLAAGPYAQAQISIGCKGGLNLSDVVINNVVDPDTESDFRLKTGFHAGVFAIAEVGTRTALSAELLYSNKGVRAVKKNINLHYVALPVLVRYTLADRFIAEAGPELAYLVTATSAYGYFSNAANNKVDLGLDLGLQYNILSKMAVGIRFNAGFTSVIRDTPTSSQGEKVRYQNRVLQLSLGYRLFQSEY